jgi:hypothetical protein
MIPKEVKNVKGRVRVVVRDAKTGEVLKVIEKDNIITDVGRAFAAVAFARYPGLVFLGWYMDIGTGICGPTAQDQDLCSPIVESRTVNMGTQENPNWVTYYFRRWWKGVDITLQDNTIIFHARWLPEDANNYSICEEILFTVNPISASFLANQMMWTSQDPLMNITQTIGARVIQHASFSCVFKTPSILLDIYITITFT